LKILRSKVRMLFKRRQNVSGLHSLTTIPGLLLQLECASHSEWTSHYPRKTALCCQHCEEKRQHRDLRPI
jgi:hypothetical protein